jgi:hypothetical protein
MEFASLLGLSFGGALIWAFAAEGWAVYYGTALGWHPLAIGLVCATGQCAMYTLLYWTGGWMVLRWPWLARQIGRTRQRFARHLVERYLVATAVGALLGMPPMTGMAVLGRAFSAPYRGLIVIAFVMRFIRFTILGAIGTQLQDWWAGVKFL